jgi:hypothetical protein
MIKIGNRVINTDAIAHVNLMNHSKGVTITMLSITPREYDDGDVCPESESLFFEGQEAEALLRYFQTKCQTDITTTYQ